LDGEMDLFLFWIFRFNGPIDCSFGAAVDFALSLLVEMESFAVERRSMAMQSRDFEATSS
jgi:hypothetical protein